MEDNVLAIQTLSSKMAVDRAGMLDMWNAFMVKGARFSPNDIPLCQTTAIQPPSKLVSYYDAKAIHKKEIESGNREYCVDAFVHFYIDDQILLRFPSNFWSSM